MGFLDRLQIGYAALPLRLGLGIVFLIHGIAKVNMGLAGVSGFFGSIGIPMPAVGAAIVIAMETLGAACLILGVFTRYVAAAFAFQMLVAILMANIPANRNFELEGLLLAGALSLVVLGDGALSVGSRMKK